MKVYDAIPKVEINMDKGVYLLNLKQDKINKLLFNILWAVSRLGNPVVTYEYKDSLLNLRLGPMVEGRKPEVIMIDGFDKIVDHLDSCFDVIKEMRDKAVILISAETLNNLNENWAIEYDTAFVDYSSDRISVFKG